MDIQRLRELASREPDVSQKDLAVRIVEHLGAHGEVLGLATVEQKLSKLLANKLEGRTHFTSSRRRLEALASALGVSPEDVERIFAFRRILLDPELPPHAAEALRRQALAHPDQATILDDCTRRFPATGRDETPFGRVRVTRSHDKTILRDASDRFDDALVVLASDVDEDHFKAHQRETDFVKRVSGGYELETRSGLVPAPKPTPPNLWAGGVPHVAHPDLTAWVRAQAGDGSWGSTGSPLFRELTADEERGREPAFALDAIGGWLETKGIRPIDARRSRYADVSQTPPSTCKALSEDAVWWHTNVLYAIGPNAQRFADLISCHDVVVEPAPVGEWRHALETRNPFDARDFVETLQRALAIGLPLQGTLAERIKQLDEAADQPNDGRGYDLPVFDRREEGLARDALHALSQREVTNLPFRWRALRLYLGLAADGMLTGLRKDTFEVAHLIASLGAGRALQISIRQFEGPATGALDVSWHSSTAVTLDGGGTHVRVESFYDELLEGGMCRPRRRREDALANAYDDDDH